MPRHHPITSLPFDATDVAHDLLGEFAAMSRARQRQLVRKARLRELALTLTGQRRRRVARVPAPVRAMLWVYTWTTVGDAIMDLAARRVVPDEVEIDLLIAPALAPLFATDRRLRTVYTHHDDVPDDAYDFILLDSMRSSSLRMKARRFKRLPWATMREHNAGERFDRAAFADRRIRHLFGLPAGPIAAPWLDIGERDAAFAGERTRIVVPLGARAAGRRYPHWREALGGIVEGWPADMPAPLFRFLGTGESAHRDLASLGEPFVAAHGRAELERGDLRAAALAVAASDAFLGVDGGLMHVAAAVGTPGLALFAHIDPAYRLRPTSVVLPLMSPGEVSDLLPAHVAETFLAALPRLRSLRSTGFDIRR